MIELVLLGKPRGKQRPRMTRAGRAYTPKETVNYEAELKHQAFVVMGDRPPMQGPLEVVIDAHVPIPASWSKKKQEAARSMKIRPTSKPDFDNYAKMIDACNLVVWVDDGQIVDGRVRKFYSDKPRMVIRVEQVETESW